jgi:predicted nucleotidyltransferase
MRKDKVMNQLQAYKSALEEKGYKVVYIGLYGSQNYNLQDKKSDIDAKAIVIPSLKEIVFKQNISRIEKFPEGQVDVKDITTFYSVIKKGNFNYICKKMRCNYSPFYEELSEMGRRNNFQSFLLLTT